VRFTNTMRRGAICCTALTAVSLVSQPALAQAETDDDSGLDVIIVTAQKREQSLQDVPIAVTAIGGEALKANRVTNVVDLSGLAPGVTVRTIAGGSAIPGFTVRGQSSLGLGPGTDKQTSIYLDGVYLSSPRGSIFDLPDVERIEILRGPQGTLFGRNATTGAVSITTRDPSGEPSVTASATIGNQDHYRWRVSAETPQMGPLSAYFSYLHEERRGDIKNLAPSQAWDRTASLVPRIAKVTKSAEWLGSKEVDSYFAALKFESGDFATVYKYDRADSSGTPEAAALIALNRSVPLLGNFLGALVDSNGVPFASPDGKRPKGVFNSYSTPNEQTNFGHSLTSTYTASDSLSFKSILAYRSNFIFAASAIDGVAGLTFTPQALVPYATFAGISALAAQGVNVADPANAALVQQTIGGIAQQVTPLIGQPFVPIASGALNGSRQWSAELQANYNSDLVTATVGAMWFKGKDRVANHRLQNTLSFKFVPGGVLPSENIGEYFNEAKSIAAYAQAEIHATPQLDVILGARITNDKKSGTFTFGPTPATLNTVGFDDYNDTQFNYLVGLNYKPSDDILLYAKYSTAYVSGGAIAGIPFDVEKAKSAEAGIKAEVLNRKLRTNLTGWWAKATDVQSVNSANTVPNLFAEVSQGNPAAPFISLFALGIGDRESYGFEFEFMAAPARGVTLGGSASYTHISNSNVPQELVNAFAGNYNGKVNFPAWTASGYAQYETPPLFGDAYLSVRADAIYQDKVESDSNLGAAIFNIVPDARYIESYVTVNGRVALREVNLGGLKADLALWGRNLFDKQRFSYALNLNSIFEAANYIPARSYGLDLTVSF